MSATTDRDETSVSGQCVIGGVQPLMCMMVQTGSTKSFVTALVLGLIVFGAEMAVFGEHGCSARDHELTPLLTVYAHNRNKKVYQPRTFLAPANKRVAELSPNPIRWFQAIYQADKREGELSTAGGLLSGSNDGLQCSD